MNPICAESPLSPLSSPGNQGKRSGQHQPPPALTIAQAPSTTALIRSLRVRAASTSRWVRTDRPTEEAELSTRMAENGFSFLVAHSWSICRDYAEEFLCGTLWLFSAKIPENIFCCLAFCLFFHLFVLPGVCILCLVWSEQGAFS